MIWPAPHQNEKFTIVCMDQLVQMWGKPLRVKSDNAYVISGKVVEEYLASKDVELIKSLKYQPASNGIAERAVRTVKDRFRKNEDLGEWDILIEPCLSFLNPRPDIQNNRIEDRIAALNLLKVGDTVYILKDQKGKRFKHKGGTEDNVTKVLGSNSVELENNGIWSLRHLT